jgi:uncharacterized OsmC-like protein
MIQYPMSFPVSSKSSAPTTETWTSSVGNESSLLTSILAIPPEFDGPGGGHSPEDLYAMALLNCFIATFKVVAEKSRFPFKSLVGHGILTVDRNESGVPWMKSIALRFTLSGTSDPERAKRILEKTSQSCMILNSVLTEKSFEFEVKA